MGYHLYSATSIVLPLVGSSASTQVSLPPPKLFDALDLKAALIPQRHIETAMEILLLGELIIN